MEYGAVSDRAESDVGRRALICGVQEQEQGFMEIIRRRIIMNLSSFHCFVRQLTNCQHASFLNREWGWADLCGVWGCFRSCRRRSTGADIRPRTRFHGNLSTLKYDELVFIILFRAFSLSIDPLERAIKSPSHEDWNSPRKRDTLPRRVFFKAVMLEYNTERYGSTKDVAKTWHRTWNQHGV